MIHLLTLSIAFLTVIGFAEEAQTFQFEQCRGQETKPSGDFLQSMKVLCLDQCDKSLLAMKDLICPVGSVIDQISEPSRKRSYRGPRGQSRDKTESLFFTALGSQYAKEIDCASDFARSLRSPDAANSFDTIAETAMAIAELNAEVTALSEAMSKPNRSFSIPITCPEVALDNQQAELLTTNLSQRDQQLIDWQRDQFSYCKKLQHLRGQRDFLISSLPLTGTPQMKAFINRLLTSNNREKPTSEAIKADYRSTLKSLETDLKKNATDFRGLLRANNGELDQGTKELLMRDEAMVAEVVRLGGDDFKGLACQANDRYGKPAEERQQALDIALFAASVGPFVAVSLGRASVFAYRAYRLQAANSRLGGLANRGLQAALIANEVNVSVADVTEACWTDEGRPKVDPSSVSCVSAPDVALLDSQSCTTAALLAATLLTDVPTPPALDRLLKRFGPRVRSTNSEVSNTGRIAELDGQIDNLRNRSLASRERLASALNGLGISDTAGTGTSPYRQVLEDFNKDNGGTFEEFAAAVQRQRNRLGESAELDSNQTASLRALFDDGLGLRGQIGELRYQRYAAEILDEANSANGGSAVDVSQNLRLGGRNSPLSKDEICGFANRFDSAGATNTGRAFPQSNATCAVWQFPKGNNGRFCSCTSRNGPTSYLTPCPTNRSGYRDLNLYRDVFALPNTNDVTGCFRVNLPAGTTCFTGPTGPRFSGLGGEMQLTCRKFNNQESILSELSLADAAEPIQLLTNPYPVARFSPFTDFQQGPNNFQDIISMAQNCLGPATQSVQACDTQTLSNITSKFATRLAAQRRNLTNIEDVNAQKALAERLDTEARVFGCYFAYLANPTAQTSHPGGFKESLLATCLAPPR